MPGGEEEQDGSDADAGIGDVKAGEELMTAEAFVPWAEAEAEEIDHRSMDEAVGQVAGDA